MPEGHTIHRLAHVHNRILRGHTVQADSPQGRFAGGAARLSGRVLCQADAHGKHLLHSYDGDVWLHVHLGLYGRFDDGEGPPPQPRGAVRLRLTTDHAWAELRGPTACEVLTPEEVAALRGRLGADPLRTDADPERVWSRITASRVPVAALLLDQKVIAGVGNAYRAEVLFRHGIEPHTPGRELVRGQWDALWVDLVALLRLGVATGRIDTVRDEHSPEAQGRPPRQDRHGGEVYVYRRAGLPCLVCATPVDSEPFVGRNLYWCRTCQPAGRAVRRPRKARPAARPPQSRRTAADTRR